MPPSPGPPGTSPCSPEVRGGSEVTQETPILQREKKGSRADSGTSSPSEHPALPTARPTAASPLRAPTGYTRPLKSKREWGWTTLGGTSSGPPYRRGRVPGESWGAEGLPGCGVLAPAPEKNSDARGASPQPDLSAAAARRRSRARGRPGLHDRPAGDSSPHTPGTLSAAPGHPNRPSHPTPAPRPPHDRDGASSGPGQGWALQLTSSLETVWSRRPPTPASPRGPARSAAQRSDRLPTCSPRPEEHRDIKY
ncbi:vegetative cell wall protein gp1-like [Octodon degus]|uniref:Vegetative cell wall protein gp1-like n=1 Tax=Octodon degus TaxID=10160 RepID=A0A6P3VDU5_OCTDE|nr:vegetative cell wall protein gp1-like [Octodon degus]